MVDSLAVCLAAAPEEEEVVEASTPATVAPLEEEEAVVPAADRSMLPTWVTYARYNGHIAILTGYSCPSTLAGRISKTCSDKLVRLLLLPKHSMTNDEIHL